MLKCNRLSKLKKKMAATIYFVNTTSNRHDPMINVVGVFRFCTNNKSTFTKKWGSV